MITKLPLPIRHLQPLFAIMAVLLAATLSGCSNGHSDSARISGTVTAGGQPIGPLEMRLHFPDVANPYPIMVRKDGKFSSGDLPVGHAKVTFHAMRSLTDNSYPGTTREMDDEERQKREEMRKMMEEKMGITSAKVPSAYSDPKTTPESWEILSGDNSKEFNLSE
jgi:hypothetical protein